jgi:hypothetical protein
MRTLTRDGLVPRSSGLADSELRHDLLAVRDPRDPDAVAGWLCRPAVLRRVADRMAALVAADTDRLVAAGPGAGPLAAAVGLASGLPFAVLTDGELFGERHAGESVTVLTCDDRDLPGLPAGDRVVVFGTPAAHLHPVLDLSPEVAA